MLEKPVEVTELRRRQGFRCGPVVTRVRHRTAAAWRPDRDMTPPRIEPQDGVAWVTGASSGIGAAVALELARRGWTVAATARRLDRLEALALSADGLPGRIVAHCGDVADPMAMAAVVEAIESVHGPIALAFLNAGIAPRNGPGARSQSIGGPA